MISKIKALTAGILILFSFASCAIHVDKSATLVEQSSKKQPAIIKGKNMQLGTVIFLNFEGGFYGIKTSSGEKLLPMNLAKEYKVNGTEIKFDGQLIKDMMTTVQWGTPVKLTKVELIKMGSGGANNATH